MLIRDPNNPPSTAFITSVGKKSGCLRGRPTCPTRSSDCGASGLFTIFTVRAVARGDATSARPEPDPAGHPAKALAISDRAVAEVVAPATTTVVEPALYWLRKKLSASALVRAITLSALPASGLAYRDST